MMLRWIAHARHHVQAYGVTERLSVSALLFLEAFVVRVQCGDQPIIWPHELNTGLTLELQGAGIVAIGMQDQYGHAELCFVLTDLGNAVTEYMVAGMAQR